MCHCKISIKVLIKSLLQYKIHSMFPNSAVLIFFGLIIITSTLFQYHIYPAHGQWINEYDSPKYTKWFFPSCNMQPKSEGMVNIAVINPTFTGAAYHHAFYDFYQKYNYNLSSGFVRNISSDLHLLSSQVPNATMHSAINTFVKVIPERLENLLGKTLNMCILTDQDLEKSSPFDKMNRLSPLHEFFDIAVIFHEEYVTPKIYGLAKNFVSDGGTLLILSGNTFYAEVRYDKLSNNVTLVNGHNWAFNNRTAFKGMTERWQNETSEWMGSNFYHFALPKYKIVFYNNPFDTDGIENNYVSNKNAKIILDYNSSDLRFPIAAYELLYGKGKVVSIGVGSDVIRNDNFLRFFDDLVVNYALPSQLSTNFHVPHFTSPSYKPALSQPNMNGIAFKIVGDDFRRIHFGTFTNGSQGEIFRIIGQTQERDVHLISQPTNFTGANISLTLGDILKYGNSSRFPIADDVPIHFKFKIHGNRTEYVLDFVQGTFWERGWDQKGTYYVGADVHSTSSINVEDLLREKGDTYLTVNEMRIELPSRTAFNPLDFRVNISGLHNTDQTLQSQLTY